jgi:alpha-1,3-rhamnosyltransferase
MPELVSVLIPAYNHERYVQQTIRSLMEQSHADMELIVIDDGSSDGTWERLQEMRLDCASRFARVVFERQENQGLCPTVNRLLGLMQGEYAYMIASDDLAKPEAVETLCAFLSRNPEYGLAVGDNELVDEDSCRIYWDRERRVVQNIQEAAFATFGAYLRDLRRDVDFLSEDFGGYGSLLNGNYVPNGLLIRRSAFEGWSYTPEAPVEDWFMALQVAKRFKMKFFDRVLFSYRWHSTNRVKQTHLMSLACRKTFWHEIDAVLAGADQAARLAVCRYLYWRDTPGAIAVGLFAARCRRRLRRRLNMAAYAVDRLTGRKPGGPFSPEFAGARD